MRKLLEDIGFYAIKKFLNYLMRRYDLRDDRDALDHIATKMEKSDEPQR